MEETNTGILRSGHLSLRMRILIGIGTLLCIALTMYYILVIKTGIPCLFHELTGWYCPGCGTGRAIRAFVHGEFRKMLSYNILTVFLGIPCVCVFIHEYLRLVFPSLPLRPVYLSQRKTMLLTAVVILFWILRNIPAFSFLAPG